MVKGGDENVEINNTFYQKDQGILDNCLDKIYENTKTEMIYKNLVFKDVFWVILIITQMYV